MTGKESTVKIKVPKSTPGDSIFIGEGLGGLESVFLKGTLDDPNGNQPQHNCCQVLGQHAEIC